MYIISKGVRMNFKILSTTIIFVLFLATSVLAVPGVPNQFYGSVTINGQPAPDGTTVTAEINGAEVKSTTTSNGEYNLIVDDPQGDRIGDTVYFFVDGIDTGKTASFCNGCSDRVDLSITKETSGGSPGGGGGSSGGSTASEETTTTTVGAEESSSGATVCQEKWVCTDWNTCKDGLQTRKCIDQNSCGTDERKPMESQPCSLEEAKQQMGPIGFFLTSPTGIGAVIAIIIAILAAIVWKFKFKK